jgi:hypothetical protein
MSRNERIAARLIAALDPLIPASCATSIHGGWLEVAVNGHWWVSIDLGVAQDQPAVLAFNVLNTIQDVITVSTTRPWPPASEPTYLAYPEAAVRQGLLVAWFGPEGNATLTIPPIDLATV